MGYKVGDIVHVRDPFARDDGKDKFMVIVDTDPHLFMAVNTHDYGNYDSIPLNTKPGRDFPRHNSFIGCKHLHQPDVSQITETVGSLDDDDLRALKAKFEVSLYLTGYQQVR